MAEKKIQENSVPDGSPTDATDKQKDVAKPPIIKVTSPLTIPVQVPRLTISSFTKQPPNELYRKLLPALLFILTFVTVMTMLLIYMDTFALGAQQFRQNMTQDKELANISAESPSLVAYVRQLHLAPRPPRVPPPPPAPTARVAVLDRVLGALHNGTLLEFLVRGPRDATAAFLQRARGWRGVAVRAAPRDFLALRGAVALHACLAPGAHPRVVGYEEAEAGGGVFRSRVLCLPLLTVLLAADAPHAHYTALEGPAAPAALAALPFHGLRLRVIDFRSADPAAREATTRVLLARNYTVAATFADGIMYALNGAADGDE